MSQPIISVMMPAYNAEKYIPQAIESVCAQTFPSWQLIIVDDGSTDDTPKILEHYQDPRIKVFHQENGGEAMARNTALSHIESEFIAFLDADDLYLPNHLELTVNFLQSHPDIDGMYTDGYYINQDGIRLKPLSSRRRGPFAGDIFEQMVRASDVFGAPVCVVLRRNIITEHQLTFDREIIIGPDWDFLIQYSQWAKFGNIPDPTCLYRIHETNISLQTKQERRINSLARCREKAARLPRFASCTQETKWFLFYDLLVNLLTNYPERQNAIIAWPEFLSLPTDGRAKLIRLMATQAVTNELDPAIVNKWFNLAYQYNPRDWRGNILRILHRLSPRLCNQLLRRRNIAETANRSSTPFGDLV